MHKIQRIKSDKKSGIIGALLIAAATIGTIVYTTENGYAVEKIL